MNFSIQIPNEDRGPRIVVSWKREKGEGEMSFTSYRQFGETVSAFGDDVDWSVAPDCRHPMIIGARALHQALFNAEPVEVANIVAGVGRAVRAGAGAENRLREATA